jgi:hypothetical protein
MNQSKGLFIYLVLVGLGDLDAKQSLPSFPEGFPHLQARVEGRLLWSVNENARPGLGIRWLLATMATDLGFGVVCRSNGLSCSQHLLRNWGVAASAKYDCLSFPHPCAAQSVFRFFSFLFFSFSCFVCCFFGCVCVCVCVCMCVCVCLFVFWFFWFFLFVVFFSPGAQVSGGYSAVQAKRRHICRSL